MIEDYPTTLLEMEQQFASEEQCRAYLATLRWPDGFVCPSCGGRKAWPAQRGRLICAACRHQATVTAGTIFQDSRLSLRLWCRAIWQVTSQKNGASALGLAKSFAQILIEPKKHYGLAVIFQEAAVLHIGTTSSVLVAYAGG